MKKFLLTFLAVIVVLGVLAGIGLTGYRYGMARGVATSLDGNAPTFGRGNDFNGRPGGQFEFGMRPDLHHGFGLRSFHMQGRGGFGFGFFPFRILLTLAFWGVVIWLGYKLLTGWRLTLVQPNQPAPVVNKPEPESTSDQTSE